MQYHKKAVPVTRALPDQFQATKELYNKILDAYTENKRTRLDVLKAHDLSTMPDELIPYFIVLYESMEHDPIGFLELFNSFVDAFYASED